MKLISKGTSGVIIHLSVDEMVAVAGYEEDDTVMQKISQVLAQKLGELDVEDYEHDDGY